MGKGGLKEKEPSISSLGKRVRDEQRKTGGEPTEIRQIIGCVQIIVQGDTKRIELKQEAC